MALDTIRHGDRCNTDGTDGVAMVIERSPEGAWLDHAAFCPEGAWLDQAACPRRLTFPNHSVRSPLYRALPVTALYACIFIHKISKLRGQVLSHPTNTPLELLC